MKSSVRKLSLLQTVAGASVLLLAGWVNCAFSQVADEASIDANDPMMVKNIWADVPLSQVLRDISIETGTVIANCPHVPDPLVSLDTGSGKPVVVCLQELLSGRGLFTRKKSDNFYLVSCGSPSCPSSIEIAEYKRLLLKYISAKHLKSSLPKSVEQHVSFGERENEVLVYAAPEIAEHILKIIGELDIPRQQVVLEVLVVELWEEASEQFGLDWVYSDSHNVFSMQEGLGFFTGLAQYTSVPKSELTRLLLTLRTLIGKNKAAIRSRPRVATQNGEKAVIDISLEEYFSIVTDYYGAPARLRTELEVIKSGVILSINPHIGDNNDITVDVATEVSDVATRQNQLEGNISGDLPIIKRRKVDTCIRVKDGDAIVIGGLIETQERSKDKRIPILSSIPLIGGLFTAKESFKINKEVMIFITPRLIGDGTIETARPGSLLNAQNELAALRTAAPSDQIAPDANSLNQKIISRKSDTR